MAGPSVTVSVSDQSIFSDATPSTIPLIVFATRAAKPRPDGNGTAPGTLEANKLRLMTSQRDLIQGFGNPVFVTSAGAPVHGHETNEYGLMAAHTVLGLVNRCYTLRADIDLGELLPTQVEPTLPPPDGTFWIQVGSVVGGVFRYNGTSWAATPFHVYTTAPGTSDGSDGDFAFDYSTSDGTLKFKNGGTWFAASTTNLNAQIGSTTFTVSSTVPSSPATNDIWYKTTASAGGTNLQLVKYRAADGSWVAQTITRAGSSPTPNQGLIWEDVSNLTTNGHRPLYIGTGAAFIPLPVFVQVNEPVTEPETGTLWFNDDLTDFALYVEGSNLGFGNQWVPVTTTTVSNPTASQKVISASAPQFPNDGAIWVDVSTPANRDYYPVIKKYSAGQWVDITSSVIFKESDPVATVVLDGTYWVNTGEMLTRNTVKSYNPSFTAVTVSFNGSSYSVVSEGTHWEPATGAVFGRKSVRQKVVDALQATINSNQQIRAEATYFQLIAAPGYPELYDEMLTLNTDQGEVSFIVADTPKYMIPTGFTTGREVAIPEWVTNSNNVAATGEEGFSSAPTPYAAFYYPWGIASDLSGNDVFVPPSHAALRTIAYSDSISAPWFPPAGLSRGAVDNLSSVGYLDDNDVYQPTELTPGMRSVAYDNNINPIAFIPNRGLVIYGQKTNSGVSSALDRINVARLISKMKYDLQRLLEPFLFEINDSITQRTAQIVTESYLAGLKSLRALYDFASKCDSSNNTPDRVDAHQLYVDVAIKPAKSIEFIFVPIQVLNTADQLPF